MLAGKYCFLSEHCGKTGWLIDSGATDHICSNLSAFVHYTKVNPTEYITIPDGKQIAAKHTGYVQLTADITLHNVLHVLDFHFNLISVQKLCQDLRCEVLFTVDKCVLQGLSQKNFQMPLGERQGGLYSINTIQAADKKLCFTAITDAKVWHLRLGHIPFSSLKLLLPQVVLPTSNVICQICPRAKQTKLKFPHSSIKTKAAFEMIHIDVWGPYQVKSSSGCNQFLTIVDDSSRFTWIHLIKHKSECAHVLHKFFKYVKNQFKTKVYVVRSDNVREFYFGFMNELFHKYGIIHQTSCSYTPQQNGVLERKHRFLLETARSLYFQSKVPAQYWGECMLCATYLINIIPLQSLSHETPYFRLYHTPPDLTELRTFGCLCFVGTSTVHRSKFDPRATMTVFMGYSPGQKGYKVLNWKTKQLSVSMNVVFHEANFSFHSLSISQQALDGAYLPMSTGQFFVEDTSDSSHTHNADHTHDADVANEIHTPSANTPSVESQFADNWCNCSFCN